MPLSFQNTSMTSIIFHFVRSVNFYSYLKLKILLHKFIYLEEKCKKLELRGFAHLGIDFKNSLGMMPNQKRYNFCV